MAASSIARTSSMVSAIPASNLSKAALTSGLANSGLSMRRPIHEPLAHGFALRLGHAPIAIAAGLAFQRRNAVGKEILLERPDDDVRDAFRLSGLVGVD